MRGVAMLETKPAGVVPVGAGGSSPSAAHLVATLRVGTALARDDAAVVGLTSERDLVDAVAHRGRSSAGLRFAGAGLTT